MMKLIFVGLCILVASSSAGYQKGFLVGFELKPQSDAQVKTLINLRDSEDGVCWDSRNCLQLQYDRHLTDHHFLSTLQYLFWSGRIAMGKTTQALIPLDLMERFTDAVQNASIAFKPAFSPIPVTM
jgi:hypothetical protein